MKQESWTRFKQKTVDEIMEGPCLEITKDGEPKFQVIVGAEAEMRVTIQSHASMIDAARGKR